MDGSIGGLANAYGAVSYDLGHAKNSARPCTDCEHSNKLAGCECKKRGCRCNKRKDSSHYARYY
jgi:hypothetical protein